MLRTILRDERVVHVDVDVDVIIISCASVLRCMGVDGQHIIVEIVLVVIVICVGIVCMLRGRDCREREKER